MNSNSYFAQLYFPAFYFSSGTSTATAGYLSALIIGSSTVLADLTETGEEAVYGYSAYTLTKVQPKFPEITRVALSASIAGVSATTAVLVSSLALSAIVSSSSDMSAELTENKEARIRYRRRKEEEVLTYFLLAA